MLFQIVIYIYRSLSYQKEGGAVDASGQKLPPFLTKETMQFPYF